MSVTAIFISATAAAFLFTLSYFFVSRHSPKYVTALTPVRDRDIALQLSWIFLLVFLLALALLGLFSSKSASLDLVQIKP
jgi:hypothetical protein